MIETFYRIWSPSRGYWDGGCPREPSSWGCRPSVARIPFDDIEARRRIRSMRGGANPPCPDARLVRVTVRRKKRADVAAKLAYLDDLSPRYEFDEVDALEAISPESVAAVKKWIAQCPSMVEPEPST